MRINGVTTGPNLPDDEILRILHDHNPWWTKKPIPEARLKQFKRDDFYRLKSQLGGEKIDILIGARRVGKTTLLYQIIDELLSEKILPENIVFVSLDDQYLHVSLENMNRIFNLYSTYILKKTFDSLDQRIYIILDEVQAFGEWQNVLKRWYDLGHKIKFIVSGSSSTGILGGTSESLVGRIRLQVVLPMKFLEFFKFKEQDPGSIIKEESQELLKSLKESISEGNPNKFFERLEETAKKLSPYQTKIQTYLNEYLIKGGYPENICINDLTLCGDNLRTYVHLTLYKDIIKNAGIRDPRALEKLLLIIARESSQTFNRENIAKTIKVHRIITLNQYIKLLKETFLVTEAEYYTGSVMKQVRRENKMYVNDVGIRNVEASMFGEEIFRDPAELGKIMETAIADHTKRLKSSLEGSTEPSIFYWHDTHEVDLVIEIFQRPLPIEVKYRESVSLADLKGVRKFSEKYEPPVAIVITKNQLEIHDNVIYTPAWLYMLIP
jgi:predicted AAA+ superfamily ATPase